MSDAERETLLARARAVISRPAVVARRPPAGEGPVGERPDMAALYAVADGLELADGTRILGRQEAEEATAWLKDDKSLEWDADLTVIGERDDLVIVRDTDARAARCGGGVLEAPTDGLSSFRRVALGVIGYLEVRTGAAIDPDPAPEIAAREAIARGSAAALAEALDRGFYPGSARDFAHAALSLGALHAKAGDHARAMEAFARAAEARVGAVPRGAESTERSAAWRAAAIAADAAGAGEIAAACRERATP